MAIRLLKRIYSTPPITFNQFNVEGLEGLSELGLATVDLGADVILAPSGLEVLSEIGIVPTPVETGIYPYTGSGLVVTLDFDDFVSETDFRSIGIGVYAGHNNHAPTFSADTYNNWVVDSIFGHVMRYNYSAAITNETDQTHEGRTATHNLDIRPFATFSERQNVAIRYFFKADADWWPQGDFPTGAANSQKGMFMHWDGTGVPGGVGFRGHFWGQASTNQVGWEYGQAIGGGGSPSATTELIYGTPADPFAGGGWFQYNGSTPSHVKGWCKTGSNAGDAEWWELVMMHRTVQLTNPGIFRGSFALRKFTQGGTINPGPWVWRAVERTFVDTSYNVAPVQSFSFGQNRNKGWPVADGNTRYIYWGPAEVVVGVFNPFNIPQPPGWEW